MATALSDTVLLQVASPGEGDPIASLSVSLDGAILAVQRGTAFLQFVHLKSSKLFVQVLTLHPKAQHSTNGYHVQARQTPACFSSLPDITKASGVVRPGITDHHAPVGKAQ